MDANRLLDLLPDRETVRWEMARAGLVGEDARRFVRGVFLTATGRVQGPFSDEELAAVGQRYETALAGLAARLPPAA